MPDSSDLPNVSRPVFVSGDVARRLLDWNEAITRLQAMYAVPVSASAVPPRSIASGDQAWLRVLPAIPSGTKYFGAKLMGGSRASSAAGAEYLIVLLSKETSGIVGLLDGNAITGFRTAATSAAAVDLMAPASVDRLCVLGSGLEATMHVRAIAAIRSFAEITVFSPTESKRNDFAKAVETDLGIRCRACATPQEAAENAAVVVAAARSRGEVPILYGNWLRNDATVVSIGSTVPEQREIDVSVVERSDVIVCDVLHEVLEETGDMLAATAAGLSFADKSFAADTLMRGELEDRLATAGIRMFKSVGSGAQDVAISELILDKAIAAGLAAQAGIAFEHKLSQSAKSKRT